MKRLLEEYGLPQGNGDEDTNDAIEGAQALLCLTGAWGPDAPLEHLVFHGSNMYAAPVDTSARKSEEPTSGKPGRHVCKAARTSYITRSYVWRGPHRGALALKKQQQQADVSDLEQQHCYPSTSDGNSSRRSSTSATAPSDDDEVAQQQQQQQIPSSTRQRDKEWAALTTWLRMNLHHPRTAKKLVLFVGQQDATTGIWNFSLNPGLTWEDVSIETKMRLKTLPLEAEQAFQHKYPDREPTQWGNKVQKYRPPGNSSTVNVCLGDLVTSLNSIYYQYENSGNIAGPYAKNGFTPMHQQEQQQPQQQGDLAQLQPAGLKQACDLSGVHPAALLPAVLVAPAAALHERAASVPACVPASSNLKPGPCEHIDIQAALPLLHQQSPIAGIDGAETSMSFHSTSGMGKLQLVTGIVTAGDCTDSCNESGTPVAAWCTYPAC